MSVQQEPTTSAPCHGNTFCRVAGGCEECRPDQWRAFRTQLRGREGTYQGHSFEYARAGVRDIAEHLRNLAWNLETAHEDGFRLYDVDDFGVVHLCKGRVKRR